MVVMNAPSAHAKSGSALGAAVLFCDADVFHARLRPNGLRFRYAVTSLLIDLDRARTAAPSIPFFSIGRFNLFGFDARDHGQRDLAALRAHVDQTHAASGLARPDRVVLSCFPRLMGFVFDPLSVYVGYDALGRPMSAIYEVRNTFGERHSYVVGLSRAFDDAPASHECDKVFYVSPFMDMALRYRFWLTPPSSEGYAVKIIERDSAGVVLTALMSARPFAATARALLARLARTPLLGFKVLAAIHWQALRLWLRGHALRPRPPAPVAPSVIASAPASTRFPDTGAGRD
jgi:hypothetical protein